MQTIDNFSGDLTRRLLGNPLPELDRLLLEAAHEGDAAAVGDLLAQGASPSAVDDEGRHALFLAVAAGHLKCVEALLPVSDPDLQDREKWRPIFFAGREIGDPGDGEAREILALVMERADVDGRNDEGATALMRAIQNENSERALALLPRSNPLSLDRHGRSALMIAALMGDAKLMAALLPASDLNLLDKQGRSLREYAQLHTPALSLLDAFVLAASQREMLDSQTPIPGPRRPLSL